MVTGPHFMLHSVSWTQAVCPLLCPEAEGRDYYDICFTVRSGKIYIVPYILIHKLSFCFSSMLSIVLLAPAAFWPGELCSGGRVSLGTGLGKPVQTGSTSLTSGQWLKHAFESTASQVTKPKASKGLESDVQQITKPVRPYCCGRQAVSIHDT